MDELFGFSGLLLVQSGLIFFGLFTSHLLTPYDLGSDLAVF
jgi:hypothetical protein